MSCGATTAWVWFRIVHRLGLPAVLPSWPFLYLSAFGVIGVGLAHVEVYAPVALMLALFLWEARNDELE